MKIKSRIRAARCNFILIAIIFSMILMTGCGGKESNAEISDYSRAVIEKNNNIYIYGNDGDYLDIVGDAAKQTELSALSRDNKYIAFKYVEDTDRIIIYDIDDNSYRDFHIDNSANYPITDIRWFDDKIAVSLYVDKNTNDTLIYDFNTGKVINTCKGILIDIVDNGNNIVYGKFEDGKTKIYLGNNLIYTVDNGEEFLVSGSMGDKNEIAFVTFYYDIESRSQKEFLYTGKIEKNKIENVKRIEKPYNISGEVVFDGTSMFLRTQYGIYRLNNNELALADNEEQTKVFKESFEKIKATVKKTFVSENIDGGSSFADLGIYNIIWFNK